MSERDTSQHTRGAAGERLMDQVSLPSQSNDEVGWIEVIQTMDEIYANLVHYQVELEEKNRELEQARGFIDSVLGAMSDVLIVCDRDGVIQRGNAALARAVGREVEQLAGTPVTGLLTPASGEAVTGFADEIRDHGGVNDRELELRHHSGDAMPLAVNCTGRYDARGRLAGMVLIGRPVGELRQAYSALNEAHQELQQTQQQLVHSEKMASLGRLVAGVAHELNNPISFIYGNLFSLERYRDRLGRYLEAIHQGVDEPGREALRRELRIDHILRDLDPLLEGTREGAERVSDIVQDLRNFSAPRSGSAQPCDLRHIVETAVRWTDKSQARGVDIRLSFEDEMPVFGDPGQLQQVVSNLLQNAMDALEGVAEPRLWVVGGQGEGQVTLTFTDNGPGIAAEDLGRIFDPFFTTKPPGKGTGLGLSISYGIVVRHCGTLVAENGPGGGAVFRLSLPVSSPDGR